MEGNVQVLHSLLQIFQVPTRPITERSTSFLFREEKRLPSNLDFLTISDPETSFTSVEAWTSPEPICCVLASRENFTGLALGMALSFPSPCWGMHSGCILYPIRLTLSWLKGLESFGRLEWVSSQTKITVLNKGKT